MESAGVSQAALVGSRGEATAASKWEPKGLAAVRLWNAAGT